VTMVEAMSQEEIQAEGVETEQTRAQRLIAYSGPS
jgi:hypothetical protein